MLLRDRALAIDRPQASKVRLCVQGVGGICIGLGLCSLTLLDKSIRVAMRRGSGGFSVEDDLAGQVADILHIKFRAQAHTDLELDELSFETCDSCC